MFGLMRPKKFCAVEANSEYRFHRMHYCGTCKTLGQEYGHRTRFLLNFDTVFFAEILSLLSGDNLLEWQPGYQEVNKCLHMPDRDKETPKALKYAAATNILLAELKLDDHIKDLPGMRLKLIRSVFSKSFRKANKQFLDWGIATDHFWFWIRKQETIEKAAKSDFQSLKEMLEHYAEPTAKLTGLVFKNGAIINEQEGNAKIMYELGYHFGQLIYTLDAFEDIEKDIFKRQFNPLILFFSAKERLYAHQFESVQQLILDYQIEVFNQMNKLPFSKEIIERYKLRLQSNIALKLYKERPYPINIKKQFNHSLQSVYEIFTQHLSHLKSFALNANRYLISLVVFVIPVVKDQFAYSESENGHKWIIGLIAFFSTFGIVGVVFKRRKKYKLILKLVHRKLKRRWSIRLKSFMLAFAKRPGCMEAICIACMEACCQSVCDACCNCFNDGLRNGEEWAWVVVVFMLFLLLVLVIMI